MTNLELSVDTVAGAVAAYNMGADRIELCAAGTLGGLTPGAGLITYLGLKLPEPILHVLVRPREGDFVYSTGEILAMAADISAATQFGGVGAVFGVLTPDLKVAADAMADLIEAAKGATITFSRAIDLCPDPLAAVETLAELGVHRILTSGGAVRVENGIPTLRKMVRVADGRLDIMACGGIRANNVRAVIEATGVRDVHAAPRRPARRPSPSVVDFGAAPEFDAAAAEALVEAIRASRL
ncbi:copper homeostasis protein CutC [Fodinicola acaciae]|uniref:copper homeostasis protein CutC n=1 Tax=Fodinicola acaciae TaxID=2681555 RepID=UPI0013D58072|nr:copper homeostasis protein CutC [Fodinicola acaciae]